jgi:hypothetical protein
VAAAAARGAATAAALATRVANAAARTARSLAAYAAQESALASRYTSEAKNLASAYAAQQLRKAKAAALAAARALKKAAAKVGRAATKVAKVVGKVAVAAGKIAYQASGIQSIVSCVTDPTLSGCVQAAISVVQDASIVATGGADAGAVVAEEIAEESVVGAGEAVAEDATEDAVEEGAESTAEEGGEDAGEGCESAGAEEGGESFTASTKVLLASGKAIPISQLKTGMKVLATNTTTGKTQAETVTAVLVHHDTDLYDLKVRVGKTTSVVDTTSNHLFYVPGAGGRGGRWVKAGALKWGTHLRAPSGGDAATVVGGQVPAQRDGWMWDLTVPGNNDHDFYVVAGDTPVLVHNINCGLHGGDSGSPEGPGRVEGPAPQRAHDMLDMVKARPDGIGKVPGYEGNGSFGNNLDELPGGKYREWDVNPTSDLPTCDTCGRAIRGPERLLTPKSGSGSVFYTPDHYGTFYYVGEM